MPVSGGHPIRVTDYEGYDGAPSWSPDGDKIAFERCLGYLDRSDGTTIWTIDAGESLLSSRAQLEPPLHPSYFSLSPSLLPTIATGSRPFTTPIPDGIITAEIQEGNLEIAALFQ